MPLLIAAFAVAPLAAPASADNGQRGDGNRGQNGQRSEGNRGQSSRHEGGSKGEQKGGEGKRTSPSGGGHNGGNDGAAEPEPATAESSKNAPSANPPPSSTPTAKTPTSNAPTSSGPPSNAPTSNAPAPHAEPAPTVAAPPPAPVPSSPAPGLQPATPTLPGGNTPAGARATRGEPTNVLIRAQAGAPPLMPLEELHGGGATPPVATPAPGQAIPGHSGNGLAPLPELLSDEGVAGRTETPVAVADGRGGGGEPSLPFTGLSLLTLALAGAAAVVAGGRLHRTLGAVPPEPRPQPRPQLEPQPPAVRVPPRTATFAGGMLPLTALVLARRPAPAPA